MGKKKRAKPEIHQADSRVVFSTHARRAAATKDLVLFIRNYSVYMRKQTWYRYTLLCIVCFYVYAFSSLFIKIFSHLIFWTLKRTRRGEFTLHRDSIVSTRSVILIYICFRSSALMLLMLICNLFILFTGSTKEAQEFDNLSPEESKRRLAILIKLMDLNKDEFVDRHELKAWILRSFKWVLFD